MLAATRAKRDAGALDAALRLLAVVEAGPLDGRQVAEMEHLRGQIAFDQGRGGDAARLLLSAARRLEPFNAGLARETHLESIVAGFWLGPIDIPGGLREAAEAARCSPAVRPLRTATWNRSSGWAGPGSRAELARSHLLYGEWLRREHRRAEAREQLRTAHDMLDTMGMAGFAERAKRELLASGETSRERAVQAARPRPGEISETLTAQEAQVARLAREGLSNPEIGARLFISSRTVQYHLGKVFTKLGISSRGQLQRVMSGNSDNLPQR